MLVGSNVMLKDGGALESIEEALTSNQVSNNVTVSLMQTQACNKE